MASRSPRTSNEESLRGISHTLSVFASGLRETGHAASTVPAAGSPRGCRCSAGSAGSTSHSTATRQTGPSRSHGRSGPAGVFSSRRRSLARRAISTTGCGWGRRAIRPCLGPFWSGRSRRARHLGPSRPSGCHRTWRPGIWRTIPACTTSYVRSAIKDRSVAMRICAFWRSGTG
jgi:hypothetical protein